MPITYGQIQDMVLKLIDEYSSRGAMQSLTKTADYRYKIQSLTNATIYDLATTTAKIPAIFKIAHNPIQNRPSDDTSAIKTHFPGIDFSITKTNARATFFEVTGPATIVIEESEDGGNNFVPLETVEVDASNRNKFVEIRRLIRPSKPTNLVRLRFTGDYVYSFRNYVLYQYDFPTEESIQQHRPYFIYDLPDDFLDINTVYVIKNQQYRPYSDYNISPGPKRQISFNAYEGPMELEINYWRKPKLLQFTGDEETDRALEIDLADEAALIIPWNVAGEILKSEKQLSEGTFLINQYIIKRDQLLTNKTGFQGIVFSPYGW